MSSTPRKSEATLMFRVDLHVHTSYGSSCGYMTPSEAVRRAKLIGLDGVCITEHDYAWSPDAIKRLTDENEMLVLPGVEVGTDIGHILVFGLRRNLRTVVKAVEL
ncbi:PHP domain-containing protein, partial [Thermodesulfobacteriota bacterium]